MRFLKLHFFFKAMLICFAFSLNGAAPSNQKMDLGDLNPSTRLHPDSYDIYLFADLLV